MSDPVTPMPREAHTVFYTLLEDGSIDTTWIYDPKLTLDMHKAQFGTTQQPHIIISKPGRDGWPAEDDVKHHTIRDGKLCLCKEKSKRNFADLLRPQRDKQLAKLDGQFMINLEQGKDNSQVIQQKQKLRDMPTHLHWDTCETLDDFKKVTLKDVTS